MEDLIHRLRSPVRETFSYEKLHNCDLMKQKFILHWITMKYAVSRLKFPHGTTQSLYYVIIRLYVPTNRLLINATYSQPLSHTPPTHTPNTHPHPPPPPHTYTPHTPQHKHPHTHTHPPTPPPHTHKPTHTPHTHTHISWSIQSDDLICYIKKCVNWLTHKHTPIILDPQNP